MRVAPLLTLAIAAASLAGCFQSGNDATSASETSSGVTIDAARPDPVFADVVTGPSAAPDITATLESAPELRVGEWWRVRLHDPFSDTTTEFIRVLASIQGESYIFGMPHEGWWKEAVVFHTPAFGEVNRADLSYMTHDLLFTPLKFPLVDGDTWETMFSGSNTLTATVEVLDATRARVVFTTPGGGGFFGLLPASNNEPNVVLELIYDATMHEVVAFNHPFVSFEVIDHGYDFQGWVTVPRGEDLIFHHGRMGPALDLGGNPALPSETLDVAGGFNRMSFITYAAALSPAGVSCSETATGPDGASYATSLTPCTGYRIDFHEARDPDGTWTIDHLSAAWAFVFIEGIAYHQYDIEVPGGAIRSDHSHDVIR